jgi:tRNA G46 methylase TrmB
MKEYSRVLKPGGYIYITTHGENTLRNLSAEEKKKYNENGIVVINQIIEGDNKCTVFQSRKVFEAELLQGFELVDFVPGIGSGNLRQDIYLLKKI